MPHARLLNQLHAGLEFVNLCTPNGTDLQACLQTPWSDIEDQMVDRGAQRIKADYLVTRNEADFTAAKTSVRTPQQVLSELAEAGCTYDEIDL